MSTAKQSITVMYRLAAALLAWAAIWAQLFRQIDTHSSVVNFFSFFTIQSNLIGIGVLVAAVLATTGSGARSRTLDIWRGGATLYLAITGVVYALLLSNTQEGIMLPWVNIVLHQVLPVVMVLDWLFDRPPAKLPRRVALLWLVYPLAYLAYSLGRGAMVHWYPYPFLNPINGYGRVTLTSATIAVAATVMALLVAAWPRKTDA